MTKIKRDGACVRAMLYGEIDHCAAQTMRVEIEEAITDRKIKMLLLDFSQVSFMDSSGIGMLIGRYKTMRQRQGTIFAAGLNPQTEKLFKMAGLHRIIPICEENVQEENDE